MTKRAMRIAYIIGNDRALYALFKKDGTFTIYKRNSQKLMVEMYKKINRLSPPYIFDLFTKKMVKHAFRIKIL